MDIQALVDGLAAVGLQERSNYHLTFGGLIDKLRDADDALTLEPTIVGLGAYRGYYSDIALCTDRGSAAFRSEYNDDYKNYEAWEKENVVSVDLIGTPKELADKMESVIGMYFDGYKGGYNEITRDKPLWIAPDYGESTGIAVIGITDDLQLITKQVN